MATSRRTVLALLGAGTASVVLAACGSSTTPTSTTTASTSAGSGAQGAFPATITHSFGSTTIEAAPTRVATIGWSDQDMVVSLGVVPIGATAMTWGGNANKSTDWFDAAVSDLGGQAPTRYDDTDGVPVAEIAKLAPDLILATNSGVTKADYDKLSKIAPTVAPPGAAWVTSWEKSLDMVGTALGKSTEATKVKATTTAELTKAKEANPQLQGKSVVFAYLTTTDLSQIGIYGAEDNRVRTLESLGLTSAPVVGKVVKAGQFYGTVSAERASEVDSDLLLTYAESPGDLATFATNPLLGKIPAIRAGRAYAEVDKQIGLSITNPSPLSIPYLIEKFLPNVAKLA